jgi:hypothetical protein
MGPWDRDKGRMNTNIAKFLLTLFFYSQAAQSEVIFLRCEGERTMTENSGKSTVGKRVKFVRINQIEVSFKYTPEGGEEFLIDLCGSGYNCKFTDNSYSSLKKIIQNGVESSESFFINRKNGNYRQVFYQSAIVDNKFWGIVASEVGDCQLINDPFGGQGKNKF